MLLKKQQNMSKDPNIIPVFQDEAHFQAQTSITRTWAPKGSKPKVMSKPGKNNIGIVNSTLHIFHPGFQAARFSASR